MYFVVFAIHIRVFFLFIKRESKLKRTQKKRGKKASKAGISNEKITVVTTCDRSK